MKEKDTSTWKEFPRSDGVEYQVDGDYIMLRFTKELTGAKTDKTFRVASTSGNHTVPEAPGVIIGLNAYIKIK